MDNYVRVLDKALEIEGLSVCVGDTSENYHDLEHSKNIEKIVQACEDTDSPIISFWVYNKYMGSLVVLVGYGDESISDYSYNDFLIELVEGEVE